LVQRLTKYPLALPALVITLINITFTSSCETQIRKLCNDELYHPKRSM